MMNYKRYLLWVSVAAAAVLTLAACSASGQSEAVEPSPQSNDGSSLEVVIDNLPADIEITFYQGDGFQPGEEIALSTLLAEGKPVVLNFWAGLCPPCRIEMPDLQAVHEEYQDRVLLLGLDVGPFIGLGTREDGRALLQNLGITYPAGTTFDSAVVQNYGVLGMPTTFFITPEGEVFRTWTGLLNQEKMTEIVEELLEKSGE